jgi:hypothetical protein
MPVRGDICSTRIVVSGSSGPPGVVQYLQPRCDRPSADGVVLFASYVLRGTLQDARRLAAIASPPTAQQPERRPN